MRTAALAILAILATPALAMDDLELFTVSGALGGIIASETACGLTYDQDAIAAWITANVPPDRVDFAGMLQTQIMGQEYNLQGMSKSAMTAHCASIAQTAKHYGFIK